MNPLTQLILKQLIDAVGTAVVKAIGNDSLLEIAQDMADWKSRLEKATDPEERRRLEKDIRFLEASLVAVIEEKKIRISNKIENVFKAGLRKILKIQFPFLF